VEFEFDYHMMIEYSLNVVVVDHNLVVVVVVVIDQLMER
jgi:hypothetical protein